MLATNAICLRITFAACLATVVRASWWDDFTNNLATDLTPLIALFSEQATKQFLSESTTFLDNFIFAMAPLGILTELYLPFVSVEARLYEHLSAVHGDC